MLSAPYPTAFLLVLCSMPLLQASAPIPSVSTLPLALSSLCTTDTSVPFRPHCQRPFLRNTFSGHLLLDLHWASTCLQCGICCFPGLPHVPKLLGTRQHVYDRGTAGVEPARVSARLCFRVTGSFPLSGLFHLGEIRRCFSLDLEPQKPMC